MQRPTSPREGSKGSDPDSKKSLGPFGDCDTCLESGSKKEKKGQPTAVHQAQLIHVPEDNGGPKTKGRATRKAGGLPAPVFHKDVKMAMPSFSGNQLPDLAFAVVRSFYRPNPPNISLSSEVAEWAAYRTRRYMQ
jgi:hypothetical protein